MLRRCCCCCRAAVLALLLALLAARQAGGEVSLQLRGSEAHHAIGKAPRRARALRAVTPAEEAQANKVASAEAAEVALPAAERVDNAGAFFSVLLRAAGVSPAASKALVFDKLQSAILTTEAITITDTAVSLVETYATETNTLTVVPGSVLSDAAAGKVVIIALSALFQVAGAEVRNGTTGQVGVNIPLSTVAGKNNLPGLFVGGGVNVLNQQAPPRASRRRRLLCSSRLAAVIGATCSEAPAALKRRRLLSANSAALAALSSAGLWPALAALLPPQLAPRLAAALASLPHRSDSIAAGGLDVAAAASALGLDAASAAALLNFTLAAPQGPASPFLSTFVPLFDVELTTRLLLQANQNGASVRLGPVFRVGGDGTVAEGFLLLPQFTAFVTQTTQQLAAFAAGKLRAAAEALAGNAANAQRQREDNAAALAEYFGVQFGPLPTAAVVAFELVLRSQISVNGGDLAAVI